MSILINYVIRNIFIRFPTDFCFSILRGDATFSNQLKVAGVNFKIFFNYIEKRVMASQLESDYEFAKRLQAELDQDIVEVAVSAFQQRLQQFGVPNNSVPLNSSVVVLSDSDGETERRQRSRSPIKKTLGHVSFENQQAITVSQFFYEYFTSSKKTFYVHPLILRLSAKKRLAMTTTCRLFTPTSI